MNKLIKIIKLKFSHKLDYNACQILTNMLAMTCCVKGPAGKTFDNGYQVWF